MKNSPIAYRILIAGGVLLAASPVQAATVILNLEADTYIRSTSATSNFGTSNPILVGTTGTSGDRMHGLLRFNFTPITALLAPGETINISSAQLVTTNSGTAGGGTPTLVLYSYGFNFIESGTGGATWNSPSSGDTTAGGTLGTSLTSAAVNTSANATNTFNTTTAFVNAVQSAFDGSNDLNLIMARNSTATGNQFTRFAQGGFALQVTYDIVPEPSAALLGGLGTLLLLRRRR
jgi:hypothetical protein